MAVSRADDFSAGAAGGSSSRSEPAPPRSPDGEPPSDCCIFVCRSSTHLSVCVLCTHIKKSTQQPFWTTTKRQNKSERLESAPNLSTVCSLGRTGLTWHNPDPYPGDHMALEHITRGAVGAAPRSSLPLLAAAVLGVGKRQVARRAELGPFVPQYGACCGSNGHRA